MSKLRLKIRRREKMKYGYARVSTLKQLHEGFGLESQEKMLIENGADDVIKEQASGASEERPEPKKLFSRLEPGIHLWWIMKMTELWR